MSTSKGTWRIRASYDLSSECVFIETDTNERIACVRNPADAELICRAVNQLSERTEEAKGRPDARDAGRSETAYAAKDRLDRDQLRAEEPGVLHNSS